jgi:hypothetical protein
MNRPAFGLTSESEKLTAREVARILSYDTQKPGFQFAVAELTYYGNWIEIRAREIATAVSTFMSKTDTQGRCLGFHPEMLSPLIVALPDLKNPCQCRGVMRPLLESCGIGFMWLSEYAICSIREFPRKQRSPMCGQF